MSLTETVKKTKTFPAFTPPGNRSTQLLVGKEVLNLLEDPGFINAWTHLYNTCPWATVFQSPSFVVTWYRVYGSAFLPILIKTEHEGKLTGLLTLAKDKNGLITGAGAAQAEYQVWLTADANDETFIKNALLKIDRFFPQKKILLKYIPGAVTLGWLKNSTWNNRCFVKIAPQPIMIINDAHFTSELKKKNRREKINRLKRLGELKFERITDYAAFVSVFDELALQSDFRKGAMYNKIAFKTDPFRKKFLLALFEQNNLHATVLKLNDKIIASNVSIRSEHWLHLSGINSHAAAFARYSPGIIHYLLLGKLLAEEGAAVFDLTPGADAYKETLATDYTKAYTLSIGNNYHSFTNRLKSGVNSYLKKSAVIVGVKPETLKKLSRTINLYRAKCIHVARQGFTSLFASFFQKLKWQRKATKCWMVQKDAKCSTIGLLNIQKDNLKDLLNFDHRDPRYSQQEFLADAMHRLEEGEHCYSWAEDGVLLGCVWVTNGKSSVTEQGYILSLSDIYFHKKGRKRFSLFLKSVAAKAVVDVTNDRLYIITSRYDYIYFEKAGFESVEVTK